jgi:sigma54-dependent transcription regulator
MTPVPARASGLTMDDCRSTIENLSAEAEIVNRQSTIVNPWEFPGVQ